MTVEIDGEYTDARVMGLDPENLEDNTIDQIQTMVDHEAFQGKARIMPDTHVGSGATIGFSMDLVDQDPLRICPNTIGVDIGCFTGDTEVRRLDGDSTPIQELAERDDSFGVYSATPDGRVKAAEATAHKTREDQELVEVELDNGRTITCTPDHEFMMRSGEYKEAQNLEAGASLMALYTGTDDHGYRMVFDSDTEEITGKLGHWMVARSNLMDIPEDVDDPVIHHKNFDKLDNKPENLEIMERDEHSRLHRDLADDDHWQSEEFEKNRISALKNREPTEREREVAVENITTWMEENPDEFKKVAKDAGERGAKYLEEFNTSERGCSICGESFDNPAAEYWHEVKEHPEETEYDTSHKNAQSAIQNHKVVSVTPVDRTEDVYCLNVPEYHNFALDAGVFVHNCGMLAVRVGDWGPLDDEILSDIDRIVRDAVPMGRSVHDRNDYHMGEDFPWLDCSVKAGQTFAKFDLEFPDWFDDGYGLDEYFKPLCERIEYDPMRAINSMGTLGGGNHFVEMCSDENGEYWFILHSGSRGIGLSIAEHWQDKATDLRTNEWIQSQLPEELEPYVVPDLDDPELVDWFRGGMGQSYIDSDQIKDDVNNNYLIGYLHDQIRKAHPQKRDVEENLDYLEGQEAAGYLIDMIFAQTFAWENRRRMISLIQDELGFEIKERVHSPHNLIDFQDLVLRKGATRAHEGERFVLPLDMANGTLICEGKGNDEWNRTAPHGSGRIMSRTQAFDEVDLEDFKRSMRGIYSTSVVEDTKDESTFAYKPADLIREAIDPTAEIVHDLDPVLSVKALE